MTDDANLQRAREGVLQSQNAVRQALGQGDAAAMASLFAEDAVLLPPDGGIIAGHAEILEFTEQVLASGLVDLISHTQSLIVEGDMAVETGTSTFIARDEAGAAVESKAGYLMVYRRASNGSWLITRDMWTAPN